jgi:leader peptidase (prepilin peptidase)/N-methyltransferase
MEMLHFLQTHHGFFLVFIGILGLIVGSFLNVVIYRLPVMMETTWHQQCEDFLADNSPPSDQADKKPEENTQHKVETAKVKFNLVTPRSTCPHCGHGITALENIPVISYLILKGKCSACGQKISPRYPIIEAVTAIMSLVLAWKFGFSWQTAAALPLTWALIALTMIDFDKQLLPDDITLPFMWLGLLLAMFGIFTDTHSSIIGAAAGYLSLWSFYWIFKLLTGKEGMGYGDFKLFAALGAWFGWQLLPIIILLSSLVGAVVGISLILFLGRDKNIPIPFGPYIATAGWIAMIWGHDITRAYLQFAGLT